MTRAVTRFIAQGACAFLLAVCAGCGAGDPAGASIHAEWELTRGGVCTGPDLGRVRTLAQPLLASANPALAHITLGVLVTDEPCAFSFPSGHVYVSAGLCRLLSDAELTAAIAHELGHLLSAAPAVVPAALSGAHPIDVEAAADDAAFALLRARGLDRGALCMMLTRLSAVTSLDAETRAALRARAGRLAGV